MRDFVRDVTDDKESYSFIGYILIGAGFLGFAYMMAGLIVYMDRFIYFLAGGDARLGLIGIYSCFIGSIISIAFFLFGLYFLSKVAPKQAQSKIGFLLGGCLLLLSTMLCLAFVIWLTFALFPLPYTGIRIEILYTILFLILVWRSIVHFKRRGFR